MTYQDSSYQITPRREHWQDWVNLVLGVWLFLSPWILNFGGTATTSVPIVMNASWDAWILGVIVFIVSLVSLFQNDTWPEWLDTALGVWVFIAPWVLGFATGLVPASWDHWIVGAAIAILGFWNATSAATMGPQARA